MNKKRFLHLALLSFCLCTVLSTSFPGPAIGSAGERPLAATVNGSPIYLDQLTPLVEEQTKKLHRRSPRGLSPDRLASLRAQALDQLIETELLYQEASRAPVPELEEAIVSRMAELRNNQPETLAGKKKGAVEDELRRRAYLNHYLQKMETPPVSEGELQTLYESTKEGFSRPAQVRVRQILILLPPEASPQEEEAARGKIEEIRRQLLAGTPFADLARERSEDASAAEGGDLGFFGHGFMPAPVETMAFSLEPDQLSPVIRSPYGFHLLKVLQKLPAGPPSLDQMRDFFSTYLEQENRKKTMSELLYRLRKEAQISHLLPTD
ncbi:MAG: peptidylprolyl isomerase [Desulfuromonadales bacterium]|nr:peptidylprolyl isomerase [Desulfuromonadales bacterium]